MPHAAAHVHVEDRGYQFADGVYEVCEILDGQIIDQTGHLDRLERSLSELAIAWPVARPALERIMTELRDVPFRDPVWPRFLRENALRVLRLDA